MCGWTETGAGGLAFWSAGLISDFGSDLRCFGTLCFRRIEMGSSCESIFTLNSVLCALRSRMIFGPPMFGLLVFLELAFFMRSCCFSSERTDSLTLSAQGRLEPGKFEH